MADPRSARTSSFRRRSSVATAEAGMHTLASPGAGARALGLGHLRAVRGGEGPVAHRPRALRPPATGHDRPLHLRAPRRLVRARGPLLAVQLHHITNNLNDPPSWTNPFGTNSIGNDMFAQVMAGVEKDIEIALTVAAMATLIGVTVGAIAGFYRGWVDSLLMRFVDLVLVLPVLAILILLSSQALQAVEQLAGAGHHHRPALVDLRGPARAGRLPVAARARLRGGVAGARRDQPAHHRQAHAAQRHRADHRQRHADRRPEHHLRVDPVVPRARRPAARTCRWGCWSTRGRTPPRPSGGSSSFPSPS